MRAILLPLALIVSAAALADQDPARLDVTTTGNALSFKIVNLSPYRIVSFEVYTQFTSGGFERLACFVNGEVKAPEDLDLKGVCPRPTDPASGKPIAYSARIKRVTFANDLVWTPGESNPQ
jgi:hypothetical protein